MNIKYNSLPKSSTIRMNSYINDRVLLDGFLTALLCNDLYTAIMKADEVNLRLLPEYVAFLHEKAPALSWGSAEKVALWLKGSRNEKQKSA